MWKKKRKSASKVESLLEVIDAMEKNKKMGMQWGRVGGYCFLGFFYETVLYMYLFFIFTYLVLAALGFHCCARGFL